MLTTAETAARLGVKRETLYAYVSRGILERTVSADGRTSLYDPADVDSLRAGRRTDTRGELHTLIATRITRVDDGGLAYRGTPLGDLLRQGGDFVSIAERLWDAEPEPWPAPRSHTIPPDLDPIDAIRMSVIAGSAADKMRHDRSPRAVAAMGRSIITDMVHAVCSLSDSRDASGSDPTAVPAIAGLVWHGLARREPTAAELRLVDTLLASLADHGLASSTFAVRVAASARADPYSAVLAGLGVLGGTLHGAASADVHELFVDAASGDPEIAISRAQQRLGRTPGWGHTVYTQTDPRFEPVMARILDAWGDDRRMRTIQRVRDVVNARTGGVENIDLAVGALTWLADMPSSAGEVFFAISRTAGWIAHAMEEYGEAPLRFRPHARYVA